MREEIHDEIAKEKRNGNEASDQDPENENAINETNHVTNVIKSEKNANLNTVKLKLKKSLSMMVR